MKTHLSMIAAAAAVETSCTFDPGPDGSGQPADAGFESLALRYTFPIDASGYPTGGAARFGPVADDMPQLFKDGYVMAVNEELYDAGPVGGGGTATMAGETCEVAGPEGTITLMVAEIGPSSGDQKTIEVNTPVWGQMETGGAGAIPVAMRWVPAPVTGSLKLYFTAGSSQYYFGITVYNHRVGVARVEVAGSAGGATAGQWVELPRIQTNRFEHLAAGDRHSALGQFTNPAADTLPVTWPGPPSEICTDGPEDRQDVAWTAIASNLTPVTPNPLSTAGPYDGAYELAAGSFGSFGILFLAYSVNFESACFRGMKLWVRSDSASPTSCLALSVADGTTASSKMALPAVTSTWQKVTYLFAGNAVPVIIDRVRLPRTTTGSTPGMFLDEVRLLE